MEVVALTIVSTAVAIWIGAIVFQSAIVAPVVFGNLDQESARVFLRTLFPRLFRLGLACGAVMAAGIAWLVVVTGSVDDLAALAGVTVFMVVAGVISLGMVPHINRARDAGPFGATQFRRLHRVNVSLTFLILLLGIALLFMIAQRAASGI